MTPLPGSRPPSPDEGVERGDDRRRVAAAQGAHLGREPFPDPPDGRRGRLDQQLAVGVAAHVEAEEIEAVIEADHFRLVLVEGQAPGRQPLREPRLDLSGLLLAVAEHDHVIGIPDRDRGSAPGVPGTEAGGLVADPGGFLQPVQRDVQQARRNRAALGSALPGRREPLARLEHARLQPVPDHVPGRERPELAEQEGMIDLVERLLVLLRASRTSRPRSARGRRAGCLRRRPLSC
jgi:hypothetical protein